MKDRFKCLSFLYKKYLNDNKAILEYAIGINEVMAFDNEGSVIRISHNNTVIKAVANFYSINNKLFAKYVSVLY